MLKNFYSIIRPIIHFDEASLSPSNNITIEMKVALHGISYLNFIPQAMQLTIDFM